VNVIAVDAADDPRLSGYTAVADERGLGRRGEFIAEGRFVVSRLIEGGRHELCSLLVNDAALNALAPQLVGLTAPIYVCAPRFFEALTGHHFHRGCLALAKRPPSADALELSAGARSLVVLDRVADADNVGSVFRSALAFGVDAVWLGPGSADPLSRKAIRTSMAASLRVPFATLRADWATPGSAASDPRGASDASRGARWPDCLDRLREQGVELFALSPREPATELRESLRGHDAAPFALLIGTEGEGLSAEVEERATRRVRIAMQPGVDSLNLGVAAGIALHSLSRV
jgi:tRNA G18 (ribose-2'-O)-methylase SpoU